MLVNGDRLAEPNETFVVNLSSPTNATIADGQGMGTILDDEPRDQHQRRERRRRATPAHAPFAFTVTLSAAYDVPVTVDYATANGTATAGSDYQAASRHADLRPPARPARRSPCWSSATGSPSRTRPSSST